MMNSHNKILLILIVIIFSLSPINVKAQQAPFSINYDTLSFMEEPLAYSIGTFTFNTVGLIDQAAAYGFSDDRDQYNTRFNFLSRVQTQLPNTMTLSFQYFGAYNRLGIDPDDDRYFDNMAVALSDEWGTFSLGNVTGSVRENTRRRRGVGNADLEFDNFYGGLDELGAFYAVRNNAFVYSLSADKEGRAETGITFARPLGQNLYSGSFRLRKGNISDSDDLPGEGDTYGAALVGSYSYSIWLLDAQLGYEHIDANAFDDKNRYFVSTGAQMKVGLLSLSAEGHIGQTNEELETSGALGARYDFARGLSANFGYNVFDYNGADAHRIIGSIRYEL